MKINLLPQSLALIIGCAIAIFFAGCKESPRDNDEKDSSSTEKRNVLQNYVEVPLEKAKNVADKSDERTKQINKALEDK